MATKTRRELVDAVLANLGVLVPGQSASDDTIAKVDDLLDPLLAQLAELDIVYVGDAGTANPPSGGAIEYAIFNPLADVLAFKVAPSFSQAGDPALKVLSDEAEGILRRLGRPPQVRKMLSTDEMLRSGVRGPRFNFTSGT